MFSPTVFIPSSFPLLCLSRFAVNLDAKEGKEWTEGKEWKEANKEGKEVEPSRSVSVMSSLSYRKRSNLDSKGEALFSALKENAASEDALSLHKAKPKSSDLQNDTFSRRKSLAADEMNDRESVISQAYTEASSRARKGMDSRWADFDKESTISYPAPSRASTRLALSPENDAKSTISVGLRRGTSRLDQSGRSLYSSSPSSPCFSRRSGGRSPGSVSRAESHMSLTRSCRLSEFDVDIDDSRSVAFTERSAYSPHSSSGRSMSMPPPQGRSMAGDDDPIDNLDIKTVSHRNYLDPDLEKAINEVLSFKPIKFKRTSLEDSEAEERKSKNEEGSLENGEGARPTSSLRRSASAMNCRQPSRSASSSSSRHRSSSRSSSRHSKSKGKSKKKKRSHSSESDSSDDSRSHRSSSKRRSKKSKKKSKKRDESSSSSSSDSESDSTSESSSGASTISYRSSSSIKKAPNQRVPSPQEDEEVDPQGEETPPSKKDEKKRKKRVDSLMMKYLYRPDSD